MRRIRGNIYRIPCAHHRLLSAKRRLKFALEKNESLLEIVSMRRRHASRRNVHVDQAEAPLRVFTRQQNRVSVPHNPNVRQPAIFVSPRDGKRSPKIIRGNTHAWSSVNARPATHRIPPQKMVADCAADIVAYRPEQDLNVNSTSTVPVFGWRTIVGSSAQ